jgi:hypothetical protein
MANRLGDEELDNMLDTMQYSGYMSAADVAEVMAYEPLSHRESEVRRIY